MNTKLIGRWGEAAAADYLKKKGYKLLGLGYRTRMGEIDLIAEDRGTLVFVEVKTRRDDGFAQAREAVTGAKQRRLLAAAELYMAERGTDRPARFDVIEVYAPEGVETKKPQINHIENAFSGR